jgi:subtilase-type serine protease
VSVKRSQSSIKRGQQAAYVVQVSTVNNGSASDVTVALTARPSGQQPTFTSGCAKGAGTATCTVSSVSDKQPATLHAQIPVAANAASVTSVKLTATASIVTSATWTPPSAAETVAVTSAPASSQPAASSPGASSPGASGTTLPLGPVPNLNSVSSSLIGAGNASALFPAINPSDTPSPSPGIHALGGKRNATPVSNSSALGFVQPGLTGQVAGLIALAVAVMLTVTRLSLRKRFRSRKQGS